jgi:spermidine/putrescine transport system substrate-binding protein
MMGRFPRRSFAALAAALLLRPARATPALHNQALPANTLRISNFPFYIANETVKNFCAHTGIAVGYTEDVLSNDILLARLAPYVAKKTNPGRDLIVMPDFIASRLLAKNFLENFTLAEVVNAKGLDPLLVKPAWDGPGCHALPWAVSMTGLLYNRTLLKTPPQSVRNLFDADVHGQVAVSPQWRETMTAILLGLGIAPEQVTEKNFKGALHPLKEAAARGQFQRMTGDALAVAMARGDITLALVNSIDASAMMADNKALDFIVPKEGGYRGIDVMVIPLGARNRIGALAFMDFVYEPRNQAAIANHIGAISPILAARSLFPGKNAIARSHDFVSLSAVAEKRWEAAFMAAWV